MIGIVKLIGQHARFAYTLTKVGQQSFTNCYPLFQRYATSIKEYQDTLWDYYSFYKVLKPFIKEKPLKKGDTWFAAVNRVTKEFLLALKKVSDVISFIQYNRFLINFCQRQGQDIRFSQGFIDELDNFQKNLVLVKTYLKGVSFFKTKHEWEMTGPQTPPHELSIRKWDTIQTGLLFASGVLSSILWINNLAKKIFPVLGTFTRTCHIAEFTIFTFKATSVGINCYMAIKAFRAPLAAPPAAAAA